MATTERCAASGRQRLGSCRDGAPQGIGTRSKLPRGAEQSGGAEKADGGVRSSEGRAGDLSTGKWEVAVLADTRERRDESPEPGRCLIFETGPAMIWWSRKYPVGQQQFCQATVSANARKRRGVPSSKLRLVNCSFCGSRWGV